MFSFCFGGRIAPDLLLKDSADEARAIDMPGYTINSKIVDSVICRLSMLLDSCQTPASLAKMLDLCQELKARQPAPTRVSAVLLQTMESIENWIIKLIRLLKLLSAFPRMSSPACIKTIEGVHKAGSTSSAHLDPEPSNNLLDANSTPKIDVFGMARAVHTRGMHSYLLPKEGDGGSRSEEIDCWLAEQGTPTGCNRVTRPKMSAALDAGALDCGKRSSTSLLVAAVCFLAQLLVAAVCFLAQGFLDSAGDEHSGNRHSNCTQAIKSSSAETSRVPIVDKLTENELQHYRDPDSCSTERGTITSMDTNNTSATWVIATGAPHHATGDRAQLSGFISEHDDEFVHAVDKVPMQVCARGAVVTEAVVLPDVWLVPGLKSLNLVSVSQLVSLNYTVSFDSTACFIRSAADGKIVGKAQVWEGGLYVLDFLKVPLAI